MKVVRLERGEERCAQVFEYASPQGGIHTAQCVGRKSGHRRHRDNYGHRWTGRYKSHRPWTGKRARGVSFG